MNDESSEHPGVEAERLNAAIDRLLADRQPDAPATSAEAELLRVAAVLRQLRPEVRGPRPAFTARLAQCLRCREAGPNRNIPRRRALVAAATMAAGLAGFAVGRQGGATSPPPPAAEGSRSLVPPTGEWFAVARIEAIRPGSVTAFTAGAVDGHLYLHEGKLVAFSAICTHMGCRLQWEPSDGQFHCPCHGAIFAPDGRVISPAPDLGNLHPPLPWLRVKVEEGQVYIWSAAAMPANADG